MRILLVNKFWYVKGGAERVLFSTKNILEQAGHQVEIFGMKHPANIFSNDYFVEEVDYKKMTGFKKIKAGLVTIYNPEARKKFEKLLKDFKPDIVHFHNIYHQLSFSLLDAVRVKKIPSVMTLHDYKLISPNYNLFHHHKIGEECVRGRFYNCLLENCLENWGRSFTATLEMYFFRMKGYKNFIKRYISPSRFLKEKFVEAGFSSDKISIISNPLDSSAFQDLGEQKVEKYVLFVGRLSEEKGLQVLLDSARLTPKIKYKIAGTGPLEMELKKNIVESGLKNVQMVGYKRDQELHKLIIGAQLLLTPSLWYENCPLSVLEAKAMKKPVIASRIGGIPEILPKEMLFEPGSAIELAQKIELWLNKTSAEKEQIGEELYNEVLTKNSSGVYYNNLMEVYKMVLQD